MSAWKPLLLNLYYYGSFPYRALRNAQWQAQGRSPVIVLFYHRIADDGANAWTASNAIFERQIGWLQRHFDMVSLAEAQHRLRAGRNARPCVTITFDDGYADNCRRALPLLIARANSLHVLRLDAPYSRRASRFRTTWLGPALAAEHAPANPGTVGGRHRHRGPHAHARRLGPSRRSPPAARRIGRGPRRVARVDRRQRALLCVSLRPARQSQPGGISAARSGRL